MVVGGYGMNNEVVRNNSAFVVKDLYVANFVYCPLKYDLFGYDKLKITN